MKFFDLEMNGLAKINKQKGRGVSYNEGFGCVNFKYTHGYNMNTCLGEWYKIEHEYCETHVEPIKTNED